MTIMNGVRSLFSAILVALNVWLISGCSGDLMPYNIAGFGIGGHYSEGKQQFLRGRGGDMDKAIIALDAVTRDDPTYRDSLTLLGRAYYNKGRYDISRQILQRAVLVNKEDEIAWLTLGIAQLQLGEDEKGFETLQGAITLVSKVSRSGYRDYPEWDSKGLVRTYIARSITDIRKGPEAKTSAIRNCETLLFRIDEEENYHRNLVNFHRRNDYSR
jgi:tetratricopeptide (TPR) repeat protein